MSETPGVDELTGREIAVTGMAGQFPGARNLVEFWHNLRNGVESVTYFSDDELLASGVAADLLRNLDYIKAGSVLEGVELFDAPFFGYNAREAETLDPQQRLFLENAWHALEDAGYNPQTYEGLIGVYAGVAWNTYLLSNLVTHPELFDGGGGFQVFIANDKDFMPTRAAYKFNLRGPSIIIQTSCSTSLVAVHIACLSLLNYECDLALVGGVTVKVPQAEGYFYQEGGLASSDGHCRPFDARAAGTIFGSGVGIVVLKRFQEALEDGDSIRAVIKSSAVNNDGSAKISYTAPSVEGQAQVIAAAQAMAGFDPETIRYIETHGTGTSLGDPVEVTALSKVFRMKTQRRGFCAIGSVKANIGHLDAAAGIAGFIKTALAIENKELPPSINFDEPNPSINFPETPFYVNSKLVEWESQDVPRRAAVSSFGVGGTNAHVILEEAPRGRSSGPSRPWQLILLSARTETALEGSRNRLSLWLRQRERIDFPDVAYTLQVGRAVFRRRLALVCSDLADALPVLEAPGHSRLHTAVDKDEPRDLPVVFMFPGQGSQHVGMAEELYRHEPGFRDVFDECATLLEPRLGFRLNAVLYPEAGRETECASRIDQTSLAQPLIFVVEYALARLWMEWGVTPAAMIGHSIGEYVAACISGVISLEDALMLVALRGRLMQQQPPGAMLAVSLGEHEILPLLSRDVSLAAVNEPSSCVLSGTADAIRRLGDDLNDRGIEFRRLHTSHAFHSSMMEPVLPEFTRQVSQVRLRPPQIPFISNLTGGWIAADQAADPAYWARHLRETVLFSRGLSELLKDPDRVFLEVGPGRGLSTLVMKHPEGRGRLMVSSTRHPKEETSDGALILESLGRLWLAGAKLDWRGFYKHERRNRVPLPVYPFDRQRYWIDSGPRRSSERAYDGDAVAKQSNLRDWFYLPSWKPSPLLLNGASEAVNTWLVMADRHGFGGSLAAHLNRLGRDVVTVEPGESFRRDDLARYTIRPGVSEDYASLFEDLKARRGLPSAVVHAFSLSSGEARAGGISQFESLQETGFYSLLFLLQVLGRYSEQAFDVTAISDGSLSITAEEAIVPEKAAIVGLCRVSAQELANVESRFIDLSLPADPSSIGIAPMLDLITREVDHKSRDVVVAYRGRQRWIESFEPVKLDGAPDLLRDRGNYLIAGGMSGNGLALAKYLARTFKARLALVQDAFGADRELDASDARTGQIEILKGFGADVRLFDADLTDADQLRSAWADAELEFGAIQGVVYAEEPKGARAFRALSEATREDCERHFRAKARALYALEEVVEGKDLDFCVLVSSLAGVLGGVGYGPYAAANLFMDSFVKRHNRGRSLPWLSIDWDLWSNDDSLDRIVEIRSDLSNLAMSAGEGEEAFRVACSVQGVDQLIVSTANLSARLAVMRRRFSERRRWREGDEDGGAAILHSRPPLPTPYAAPETDLQRSIAAVWQQVLGFQQIGIDDNFFELGGDSLVAIRVVSRLKEALESDFPVATLYQGLTVRTLAQLLAQDEGEKRQRRAAQLAGHKQAAGRRREYIARKRGRKPT